MRNEHYFQLEISPEQVEFAKELVEHSIKHHKISNIWDKDKQKKQETRKYRLIGTLGEIAFADAYQMPRPHRSFGAWDGQDLGMDFAYQKGEKTISSDVKSMLRKSGRFYPNYVLNIPASQLHKENTRTDYYFCISLHRNSKKHLIASFLGTIQKEELVAQKVGIYYPAGSVRTRKDGTTFRFNEDTYEVDFGDIKTPNITTHIRALRGFGMKKLQTK